MAKAVNGRPQQRHRFAEIEIGDSRRDDLRAVEAFDRVLARRVGGEPDNEAEHFMNCRACGQAFDMHDLEQVGYHEIDGHTPMVRS